MVRGHLFTTECSDPLPATTVNTQGVISPSWRDLCGARSSVLQVLKLTGTNPGTAALAGLCDSEPGPSARGRGWSTSSLLAEEVSPCEQLQAPPKPQEAGDASPINTWSNPFLLEMEQRT